MTQWGTIVWFLLSLWLLVLITRWFGFRLQSLTLMVTGNSTIALYLFFFLLLPGTIVHELSHLLAARLLGVGTGGISLTPKVVQNQVRLGAIRIKGTDIVRGSLIGLAPLLVGTGLVLLLSNWRFGLTTLDSWSLAELPSRYLQVMRSTDAWLWIYLTMAISNAMLPSASDRQAWRDLGLYLLVVGVVLYATGLFAQVPAPVTGWVLQVVSSLAFAFTLTIAIDLGIGGLLWAAEIGLGAALGRAVK